MLVQLIYYECENKNSSCIFYCSLFFQITIFFDEISSTTFGIVEKTLYSLYHFSGAHLDTWPLESRRHV